MKTVSESIYSGPSVVIPMAEVCYVVRRKYGIQVVMKNTTYNTEFDDYNNAAWIGEKEAPGFMKAWTDYRHELEIDTLQDHRPQAKP